MLKFRAPELFGTHKDAPPSHSATVYSFGMLLYYIFTRLPVPMIPAYHCRKLPFHSDPAFSNPELLEERISNKCRPSLTDIPDRCPKEIPPILEQCWDTDPFKRPSVPALLRSLCDMLFTTQDTPQNTAFESSFLVYLIP